MLAMTIYISLAVLGHLVAAGPSAWFYRDQTCANDGFITNNKYDMDKVGSQCITIEPESQAVYVKGASSTNKDPKPYCLFLSEGQYCDGKTQQMKMQGKDFCYAYQNQTEEIWKSYRIVKDGCWDGADMVEPTCITPLDDYDEDKYGNCKARTFDTESGLVS